MDDERGFEPRHDPRPVDVVWPAAAWPPPAGVVLAGETVELRPTTAEDTFELFVALDMPEVWEHLPWEQPYKVQVLRELVDHGIATRFPWTVRLRETGEVVGWTSYLDTSVHDARTEIGATQYAYNAWGTHVNPETKLLLLTYAFEEMSMGRVQLKTDIRNTRSQRAVAGIGAQYEGVLRRYQRRDDGTVRDSVLFSVTAEDWPSVRARLRDRLAKGGRVSPDRRPYRARRTVLAVPGSSPKMMTKAQGLAADQVFLDLEDAVAPRAKEAARADVVAALVAGDWAAKTRTVRVNATTTPWTLGDVLAVVEGAGRAVDTVMLPKVSNAAEVQWLDLTLTQLERTHGLPAGGIGIDVQIEDARGLLAVSEIAAASPRVEALHFGPGDFQASLAMRTLGVGALHPDYPGDPLHHVHLTLLVAGRAHGVQVLDGPFTAIPDVDGLRASARRVAALGFDGKWVLHPTQIDVVNEVFAPTQADVDRAADLLEAYGAATSAGRGAVLHDGEMIDEASAAMARGMVERGRAAGVLPSAR